MASSDIIDVFNNKPHQHNVKKTNSGVLEGAKTSLISVTEIWTVMTGPMKRTVQVRIPCQ